MSVAIPISILSLFALVAGFVVDVIEARARPQPTVLPVMTAKRRRVWMRERYDINPALRRSR